MIAYVRLLLFVFKFADHMYAPRPYPLLDREHVVYYDNDNKTDLFVKLDYYRQNVKIARKIAINGYLHAMKYHRSVNLLDYVLRSVHIKQTMEQGQQSANSSLSSYRQTGFDMHAIARSFGKAYKKLKRERLRLVQKEHMNTSQTH